ncbi:hypothetical protein D918_07249 [Trichuris suis]|nr:hypothetical protein D918_07249 [Trichuris suis]
MDFEDLDFGEFLTDYDQYATICEPKLPELLDSDYKNQPSFINYDKPSPFEEDLWSSREGKPKEVALEQSWTYQSSIPSNVRNVHFCSGKAKQINLEQKWTNQQVVSPYVSGSYINDDFYRGGDGKGIGMEQAWPRQPNLPRNLGQSERRGVESSGNCGNIIPRFVGGPGEPNRPFMFVLNGNTTYVAIPVDYGTVSRQLLLKDIQTPSTSVNNPNKEMNASRDRFKPSSNLHRSPTRFQIARRYADIRPTRRVKKKEIVSSSLNAERWKKAIRETKQVSLANPGGGGKLRVQSQPRVKEKVTSNVKVHRINVFKAPRQSGQGVSMRKVAWLTITRNNE